MRLRTTLLILTVLVYIYYTYACDPAQSQHGCKIYGASCTCGYGCKSEFVYKSRRACLSALRERSSNVCYRLPCLRGICIQTVQEPGYACRCEGTGYFGQRCDKACPTVLTHGLVFPHECINYGNSPPSVCHVAGGLVSKLCKILISFLTSETPTAKKVSGQYYCAGWCTRVIASNYSTSY